MSRNLVESSDRYAHTAHGVRIVLGILQGIDTQMRMTAEQTAGLYHTDQTSYGLLTIIYDNASCQHAPTCFEHDVFQHISQPASC